jgi:hypothetical protein
MMELFQVVGVWYGNFMDAADVVIMEAKITRLSIPIYRYRGLRVTGMFVIPSPSTEASVIREIVDEFLDLVEIEMTKTIKFGIESEALYPSLRAG